MNIKQKLTYMLIGCLFTLAGTVISNLTNTPTQAQDKKKAVFDKIVCKELEIVSDEGQKRVRIGSDWVYGIGIIDTFNADGTRIVHIGALGGKFGYLSTYNADSVGKKLVEIGSRDGKTGHLTIFKAEGADGEMNVGKKLVTIGAIEGRPNDGLINIYNHKGEWRSFTADQGDRMRSNLWQFKTISPTKTDIFCEFCTVKGCFNNDFKFKSRGK